MGVFRQHTNSVLIALVKFSSGALTYLSLVHGNYPGCILKVLKLTKAISKYNRFPGNRVQARYISGRVVFCQLIGTKGEYVQYIRSAGTYTRLYQRRRTLGLISLRFPSGKIVFLHYSAFVVLGRNSNIKHKKRFLTKASSNLCLGFKSKVRGVAKNPVDHPHGGRTKTNSPEKSPWG